MSKNGGNRVILGNREHRNQDFDDREQENGAQEQGNSPRQKVSILMKLGSKYDLLDTPHTKCQTDLLK